MGALGYYIDSIHKDGYYIYSSKYSEKLVGFDSKNIMDKKVHRRHLPFYFLKQIRGTYERYESGDFKKPREQFLQGAKKSFSQSYISEALKNNRGNISKTQNS